MFLFLQPFAHGLPMIVTEEKPFFPVWKKEHRLVVVAV
jgi:hypothetical protein